MKKSVYIEMLCIFVMLGIILMPVKSYALLRTSSLSTTTTIKTTTTTTTSPTTTTTTTSPTTTTTTTTAPTASTTTTSPDVTYYPILSAEYLAKSGVEVNSINIKMKPGVSLMDQFNSINNSDEVYDCVQDLLADNPFYQKIANKSYDGYLASDSPDAFAPVQLDCGNVVVQFTPVVYHIPAETLAKLKEQNEPLYAKIMSLFINDAHAFAPAGVFILYTVAMLTLAAVGGTSVGILVTPNEDIREFFYGEGAEGWCNDPDHKDDCEIDDGTGGSGSDSGSGSGSGGT